MNIGYQTSKNRVSMGLGLSPERAFRLRRLAQIAGIKSIAEYVGRLIDREWERSQKQFVGIDEIDEERDSA